MAGKKYDDLSKEDLVRLLEARDRRDSTRFGLVWEANEIKRDKALNQDFVALDLDAELSCPSNADGWRNLIIEGDNFDALRYLKMCFAGRVKCIYIDPPPTTPATKTSSTTTATSTRKTSGDTRSGANSCTSG